jgi:ABC-2 type transport system ATP-binding protein
MLVGITRPDRGAIRWDAPTDAIGRLLPAVSGYLPEDRGLYQDVPLLDVLAYFGRLRGMAPGEASTASAAWLERLGLDARSRDKLGALSKGNQQKVQFAAAVLHRPRFAILDEPFSGLDPLNQELFLSLVRDLRDQGTTVLLSAHQMSLVERLADRVFVMQHGREVLSGTVPEIRRQWGTGDVLILTVEGTPDLESVRRHLGVQQVQQQEDGTVAITLTPGHSVGDLLGVCAREFVVRAIRTEHASLHDMYIAAVSAVPPREAA